MIKDYFGDFWIRRILIAALALNAALFLFLYFFIRQTNLPVTLHYNVYWGVDYLGGARQLLLVPLIGLIILVLNSILGADFWQKNKLLAYFFPAAAFAVQIFLFLAGISLYLINR